MKENTKNARINVRAITFTAVMAALVFVFTYTFKIPFVNGYTHIGDSMIFLAIVFLGWKKSSACGRYRRSFCGHYRRLQRLGCPDIYY
ncbi:MAG: ECF transporter S component [Eubacterium sp.]